MYARPGSWLFGWLVELCPGSLWLAGRLRPRDGQREAQRGPERRSGDRTNLPCVWLEAPTIRFTTREDPHRFLGGTPEETPTDYYELGFQTEIHLKPRASPQAELCTTREAPHKQNYDQQGPYVFFVCFQQKMTMSWNCPSNCPSEQAPREALRRAESLREAQRRTERPAPQLRLSQTRRSFAVYQSTM